jgi:hypothetical protein
MSERTLHESSGPSRRNVLVGGAALVAGAFRRETA